MWINVTQKIILIVIKIMEIYVTIQEAKLIVWLITQIVIYAILKMDWNALIILLDGTLH